jgi:hypothetical protein
MKKKYLYILLIMPILLLMVGCSASDPLTEPLYAEEIYTWNGTAWSIIGGSYNSITSDAVIADNYVVRGDGGARKVQDSLATINDFGTLYAPALQTGNLDSTGKVEADRLIGDVEGYSIDVVQASDLNIALNDTISLTFPFVPNVITIDYSSRVQHSLMLNDGHTTGHSLVSITGIDTMTCNTNYTALINNAAVFDSRYGQNNNASVVVLYGGNDGVNDSYIYGVGSWVTATKTLTLTFSTVANTNDATSYIEILAIAYR